MKLMSDALRLHYQQEVTTLAEAWLVVRQDGGVFGWTTHDRDRVLVGINYRATEGMRPTSAHTTKELGVDTLDVTAFLDVSTEAEIAAGVWDDARVTHFEYRWDVQPTSMEGGEVLIKREGFLGRIQRQDLLFTAEIRGLAEQFTTRMGRQYSPVCPWRHAVWNGTTFVAGIECGADLANLSAIHDGSITNLGADASLVFRDQSAPLPEDYYADGFIHMLTGANAGRTQKVRLFQSGFFTLYIPFPAANAVGDAYRAVKGDDNRYFTCRDVFQNLVNFGGFPHIPGGDAIYSTPVDSF